jgi:NADH-quinone oxidoreductase subunit K
MMNTAQPEPFPDPRRHLSSRSAWSGIFLNRKNLIVLLMAIELMLLAVNMNFVAFSHYLGDMGGQVFVFFILTVAAAEAAIGLAILVVLFRNLRTIHVDDLDSLKGRDNHDEMHPLALYVPLAPLAGAIVAGSSARPSAAPARTG